MNALKKYISFETSDGKIVFVENYNKNHDPASGKFSSGGSSSKILEKHNASHGIKVNASDEYLKEITRLEKEGNIYKSDILLGDIPKFANDVPIYKLLPVIKYDSSKLIVYRAGATKGDVGAGSFFSVHEGVSDLYGEEIMTGRVRKVLSYKLKDDLKLVKANQRGEIAKRLGIKYDGNSQQTLEKLIAKDLRRMNYDGVIYDAVNMTYGTRMSDQNGELQIFNAKKNAINISKALNYNKSHDSKGRFSTTGDSNWKPSGTSKEAKDFSKNSKYKGTLFHGTTKSSASGINKTGFTISNKSLNGRQGGDGIYLTNTKEIANRYASRNATDGGKVLTMKINVKNPKTYSTDGDDSFSSNVLKYAKENKLIKPGVKTVDDIGIKTYFKISNDYSNEVLKDHDAIINKGFFDDIIIVKSPKSIMTFGDSK